MGRRGPHIISNNREKIHNLKRLKLFQKVQKVLQNKMKTEDDVNG